MSTMIKLQAMIDKTYYYRNQKAVIRSFDSTNGEFELIIEIDGTPTKFLKTTEEKLDLFLSTFTTIQVVEDDEPEPTHYPAKVQNTPNEEAQLYHENKKTFHELSAILLADIEKVRTNPGYVNQAKQISNSVNTLLNLTKLQLQLLKR